MLCLAILALLLLSLSAPAYAQVGVLERIETKLDEILKKVGAAPVDPPSPTGPIISNVAAKVTGPTTATFTWLLNEVATGQVEYGPTVAYGFVSQLEPRFTWAAHQQDVSGLTPATLYHYRVKSQNKEGHTSVSGNYTFTTAAVIKPPPVDPPPHPPPIDLLPGSIFVATTGNDANPGTKAEPLRTIQKAANAAKPGDVISVAAGVYRERIIFPNSGTAAARITFQGEPGAIINGADITTGWTASGCVGTYQKNSASFGYTPHTLIWNDKQIVWQSDSWGVSRGTADICRDSSQTSFWGGRLGLAGNVTGMTYIRKSDNSNPNTDTVEIAPKEIGVIGLIGKSYITVRGFTIKNGYDCARLDGGGNHIIEHNVIQGCVNGVHLIGASANNLVRDNSITQNYIYTDYGHPRSRSTADANALDNNRMIGDLFGVGIFCSGGANNSYQRNTIFRVMAGIWCAGAGSIPTELNANMTIAENTISNCADFCLLFHEGTYANAVVRDNVFHEYHVGIRLGPMRAGPVYVYRNRFTMDSYPAPVSSSGGASAIYASIFGQNFPSTGVYFYHNTFSGAGAALYLNECMSNTHWINNIFTAQRFLDGPFTCNPNSFDYNWIGGAGAFSPPPVGVNNRVFSGVRLWPDGTSQLNLASDSTARAMGLDLSKPWTVNGVTRPALPGMTPGYFSGSTPNAGAIQ